MSMTHTERLKRREQVRQAVAGGEPVREVAERYGMTPEWARKACVGIQVLENSRSSSSTYAILASLINSHDTIASIARTWQISKQRVSQIYCAAKKAGIQMPERHAGNYSPNQTEISHDDANPAETSHQDDGAVDLADRQSA